MSPVIRRICAADAPALVAIENECFSSDQWTEKDFFEDDCIVAEIDGQIAGFLVSRVIYPGASGEAPEREILNLAVAAAYRRLGIAMLLLQNELRKGGSYYLEVRESNVAAQALYRKLGFREIGRRLEYYRDPTESAIVMQMK